MTLERLEFKADFTASETGEVEGIAWPFGSVDLVGDIIEPAAVADAVGKTFPMLYSHAADQAVGTWSVVTADAEGLKVKGRLQLQDIPLARTVKSSMAEGKSLGLSIGFYTRKSAPRSGGGRTITKLDLTEISICEKPCNPGARVISHKEFPMTEFAAAITALETKLVDAGKKAFEDFETKTAARLDSIEAKASRLVADNDNANEPSEEKKAFGLYLRHGKDAGPDTLKTLTVSSDPQGGYLAPAEMSTEFIRDLVEYSPVRSVASVRTTGNPSVIYPKRTGITNAKWKGETQSQEGSEPPFGQAELVVKEVNTFVDISNQLLADSAGQAEAEVRIALAEDFGQKEGLAFVKGDGVVDPEGFMTNANVQFTLNGHATNVSADAMIKLMYAMPATYRNSGSWAMNGTTLGVLRTLKDGQGNYLWRPGLAEGQPETILGRPVVELVDMDDVASGGFPISYGDFSGYRIVDRVGLSILVNPYLLATDGITRIHATRRVAGGILQPAKFRKLKMATS